MLGSTLRRSLEALLAHPLLAGMLVASAAAPSAALAAEDLFLKLPGINGESTDEHHRKEIVLTSYSQSFTLPVSTGGPANCGAVKVTKIIDKSSPALIGAVLTGRTFPSAVITFRQSGAAPFEYYKVTLSDVLVDAITQTDSSNTDSTTIVEQVSLRGTTFKFEYTLPTTTGQPNTPVVFAWDCAKNKVP